MTQLPNDPIKASALRARGLEVAAPVLRGIRRLRLYRTVLYLEFLEVSLFVDLDFRRSTGSGRVVCLRTALVQKTQEVVWTSPAVENQAERRNSVAQPLVLCTVSTIPRTTRQAPNGGHTLLLLVLTWAALQPAQARVPVLPETKRLRELFKL